MPIPIDVIARYPLAPLLLWHGLKVRKTALVLPEADGPRHGSSGTGPKLKLLIVGDSSAAGVGAAHQDHALAGHLVRDLSRTHCVTWQLIAKTGATSASTLRRLQAEPPAQFDIAFIAIGVNDVTRGVSCAKFLQRQKALHGCLRARFGVGHIVASALPPIGKFPALPSLLKWILGAQADRFDAALQNMLRNTPDCTHLPFNMPWSAELMASDGFHPNAQAYSIWASFAAQAVRSI